MKTAHKVVGMNYTLRDDEGQVIDTSDGEPLEFLQGHDNIVPGLEKALSGLEAGAHTKVSVKPEDGYGVHNPELMVTLSRKQFGRHLPPAGAMVELRSDDGHVLQGIIKTITDHEVIIDGNHPLAGKTLHFDIEITHVREASSEELEHGHPHNPESEHCHGGCGCGSGGGCCKDDADEACERESGGGGCCGNGHGGGNGAGNGHGGGGCCGNGHGGGH